MREPREARGRTGRIQSIGVGGEQEKFIRSYIYWDIPEIGVNERRGEGAL